MNRVDIILDMEPEYYMHGTEQKIKKTGKKYSEKRIKIDHELFEHALQEGLIEKTDEGYIFIGKYEDIKAMRKNKH